MPYKRKLTALEGGPVRTGRVSKPHIELLSESQKKANHIASEQKRRANIRIGFDHLVDIVPALDNCHRSESLILHKCKFELTFVYESILISECIDSC